MTLRERMGVTLRRENWSYVKGENWRDVRRENWSVVKGGFYDAYLEYREGEDLLPFFRREEEEKSFPYLNGKTRKAPL